MSAGSGTLAKPDPNTAKRSSLRHQVGFKMLAGAGNGDDNAMTRNSNGVVMLL